MAEAKMNGAESLVRTLVASGVEVCFSNPGTSEMHFVAALDRVEGMRAILGLFEGAVTGMADGYGRMAEKPACTLLHLGPGLANGLANLHNARRAATPIVNIVGDHATYHAQYDAPLASDIAGFARPVQAALSPPGQIATLILPADTAWNDADGASMALPRPVPLTVAGDAIDRVAQAIKNGKRTTILMRGAALKERGLTAAGRIAAKSGARIACDTFTARLQRGAGRVRLERVPYFAEQIVEFFQETEQLILVGTKPPVSFFAYPGKPSYGLQAATKVFYLSHPHEDGVAALEAVAEMLGAPKEPANIAPLKKPESISDKFDQFTIGQVIARYLPEGAILSDEAATSGAGTALATMTSVPHDHLGLTGGSIGQGLPVATGAAVAAPRCKVVCVHGDGGAMYTLQALWTQAREKLDVTTVIFANRSYAILNIELARVGAGNPGPKALSMLDLHNPELDWVKLANGMGVEASRATNIRDFESQFESAIRQTGPRLIEVVL